MAKPRYGVGGRGVSARGEEGEDMAAVRCCKPRGAQGPVRA
jgi:hypothetical protein